MWTADLYFPKHEENLLKDQVSRNTGKEKKNQNFLKLACSLLVTRQNVAK